MSNLREHITEIFQCIEGMPMSKVTQSLCSTVIHLPHDGHPKLPQYSWMVDAHHFGSMHSHSSIASPPCVRPQPSCPTPQYLGCTRVLLTASTIANAEGTSKASWEQLGDGADKHPTTEGTSKASDNNGEMVLISAPWMGLGVKPKSG